MQVSTIYFKIKTFRPNLESSTDILYLRPKISCGPLGTFLWVRGLHFNNHCCKSVSDLQNHCSIAMSDWNSFQNSLWSLLVKLNMLFQESLEGIDDSYINIFVLYIYIILLYVFEKSSNYRCYNVGAKKYAIFYPVCKTINYNSQFVIFKLMID